MNYYYKVNKASLNKMFVGGKMGKQIHQAGILYFIIYEIVTRNYQLKKKCDSNYVNCSLVQQL